METSQSPVDILLLPLLFVFFGALVYGLMVDGGLKKGKLPPGRWVGIGLLVLALVVGFPYFMDITDSFKRQALGDIGKKALFSRYLAGLVPLIALVVSLGVDFWAKRRIKSFERL